MVAANPSSSNPYKFGAPFLHEGCPDPTTYDAVNPELAAEIFAAKIEKREQFIANHLKANPGHERFMAAIEYDTAHTPMATNKDQLEAMNIMVPSSAMINKRADEWCSTKLWNIIYGLARLGIFLTDTNNMTDRQLLVNLCDIVLLEEIPDIPPSADMSEFICMNPKNLPDLMVDSTDNEGNPVKVPFNRPLPRPNRA